MLPLGSTKALVTTEGGGWATTPNDPVMASRITCCTTWGGTWAGACTYKLRRDDSVGLVKLVMAALANVALGITTSTSSSVMILVPRQFISMTRPMCFGSASN